MKCWILFLLVFGVFANSFAQNTSLQINVEGLPSGNIFPSNHVVVWGNELPFTWVSDNAVINNLSPNTTYFVGGSEVTINGTTKFIQREGHSLTIPSIPLGQQEIIDINYVSTEPPPNTKLVICEIGPVTHDSKSSWLEIYNAGTGTVNLSEYQLRALSVVQTSIIEDNNGHRRVKRYEHLRTGSQQDFSLPEILLEQDSYVVVQAKIRDVMTNGPKTIVLGIENSQNNSITYPYWIDREGQVELRHNSGEIEDFVAWGTSPIDSSLLQNNVWEGERVPLTEILTGHSYARRMGCEDHNLAGDWHLQAFTTPGGPNDVVLGAADIDDDGIPDYAERELGTPDSGRYGGINYFDLGAVVGVKDIFVEVDVMDVRDSQGNIDLAKKEQIHPRQETLNKVVAAFKTNGPQVTVGDESVPKFAIHFDVGDFYSGSNVIDTNNYNLGQGNSMIPYSPKINLASNSVELLENQKSLYTYKFEHFDPVRRPIFHYMIMGSTQEIPAGSSGLAEVEANDSIITLEGWNIGENKPGGLTKLINYQAVIIMHEIGHNLGLHHGGPYVLEFIDDDGDGNADRSVEKNTEHMKPNYRSIMNYLFAPYGTPGNGISAQTRYHNIYVQFEDHVNAIDFITDECNFVNSPCNDNFVIDYSHGFTPPINEDAVFENVGDGVGPIDYNFDGQITNDLKAIDLRRDATADGQGGAIDIPSPGEVLHDFDDWAKLKVNFNKIETSFLFDIPFDMPVEDDFVDTTIDINPMEDDFQQNIIKEIEPFWIK